MAGFFAERSRCDLFRPGASNAPGWAERSLFADGHQRAAAARHFTPGGASADLSDDSGIAPECPGNRTHLSAALIFVGLVGVVLKCWYVDG